MPAVVTIDGLPADVGPGARRPPDGRPPNVEAALGWMRWSAASGLRDVSPEIAQAIDDRLKWVKAAAFAAAGVATLTLVVVLASMAGEPPARRGRSRR